ncbi:hypothetical protein LCGC14_2269160 [marine sediment metagenome]|uniref:Helix-turn-helix domain-containing protein n=2 Tax=marine sediment metagenome TaxID=412755 RepID=A0A0F9FSI0_9ZZZZ
MSCTWLTVKEAADFIKVHYTTMQKYIGTVDKPGKLKASRPSEGVIRICLADLEDFMGGSSDSPSG